MPLKTEKKGYEATTTNRITYRLKTEAQGSLTLYINMLSCFVNLYFILFINFKFGQTSKCKNDHLQFYTE